MKGASRELQKKKKKNESSVSSFSGKGSISRRKGKVCVLDGGGGWGEVSKSAFWVGAGK